MRFTDILTLALAFTASAIPVAEPQLSGLLGGLTGAGAGGNTASPQVGPTGNFASPRFPVPAGTTIGSAINSCGDNAQLNCCNKADTSGDSVNYASGILSGLIPDLAGGNGGIGLFNGCSKLSVTGLIGVADLLNSQCKQSAACCQGISQTQSGLLNVGLPCVALSGLLA